MRHRPNRIRHYGQAADYLPHGPSQNRFSTLGVRVAWRRRASRCRLQFLGSAGGTALHGRGAAPAVVHGTSSGARLV